MKDIQKLIKPKEISKFVNQVEEIIKFIEKQKYDVVKLALANLLIEKIMGLKVNPLSLIGLLKVNLDELSVFLIEKKHEIASDVSENNEKRYIG